MGTQNWMIENLAWLPVVSPSSTDSWTEKLYHVYKYTGTSISEAKESDNYKTYGVLYNWPAAMNGEPGSRANPSGVQGVCPSGWHLPGDAEWTVLTDYLGSTAGYKMKAVSGWSIGNGDNSSSFNVLPGGYRNLNGGFSYLGKNAWFWSTSADGPENALVRYLDGYFDGVVRDTKSRGYGYSVRCVRD